MNYSLGNIISNGGVLKRLDPDAAAFIAATGATDVANINAWVLGLKSQGIWNNIVSWPMRSTQNHGSGTVLRSLGGLGSFDGTLTNGPTWGANGITFDGVNDFVQLGTLPAITALGSFFTPASPITSASAGRALLGATQFTSLSLGSVTAALFEEITTSNFVAAENGGNGYILAHVNNALTISGASAVQHNAGASPSVNINGTSRTISQIGSPVSMQSSQWRIGARGNNDLWFQGTMHLPYFCSTQITAAQATQLYNLYRNTLGAGLGLP